MKITDKTFKISKIKKIIKKNLVFITFYSKDSVKKKLCKNYNFFSFTANKFLLRSLLKNSIFSYFTAILIGPVSIFYSQMLFKKSLNLNFLPFFNKTAVTFLLLKQNIYLFCQLKRLLNFKFQNQILVLRDLLSFTLKKFVLTNFSK